MKAEPNRLIPLKPVENLLELLVVPTNHLSHFKFFSQISSVLQQTAYFSAAKFEMKCFLALCNPQQFSQNLLVSLQTTSAIYALKIIENWSESAFQT